MFADLVSPAVLATAAGCCARGLTNARPILPQPDFRDTARKRIGWRLDTLRAWRPDVADRAAAILDALAAHPLETPLKRRN